MQKQSTHNLRVSVDQSAQLRELVRTGWMRQTTEPVSGLAGGRVYVPNAAALTRQCGWHDERLQLGDVRLQTQLYRLPTLEQTALVQASPGYAQHQDERLLTQGLLGQLGPAQQRTWVRQVIQTTCQGRRALPVVLGGGGVRWLQAGTRLVELEGLWFASLTFELPTVPRRAGGIAIGIDVGLSPLVTAAGPGALVQLAPPALPDRLRWATFAAHLDLLPPTAQRELQGRIQRLHYAAARQQLDQMTAWLLGQAACVGVERLDWRTFSTDFPERGREMAMVDWLQSWLPQRLYAAGVRLRRVAPYGTSQGCHLCGRPGARTNHQFVCLSGCGVMDAHENAAHNVRHRAWGGRPYARRKRQRRR
ncbi:hypothetical protein GCM10010840_08920 [Deinococcus aerolatus]|uniref:Cas12f1-like TNB domain-containing protein n=1 Tax=Deinococcus aerolatus TaxID=522487 RepID=A0ABQ2G336_9DEIO|nr:zinc ribbon domain-containing protein [Deinococcus aerolatus]GGL73081.1 hypothetical protein GCM10010840_08920 [Deinococcus aerolatus]